MATENRASEKRHQGFAIGVAEAGFEFREARVCDPVPTGRQVLNESGFRPAEEHLIFHVEESGALEELRLEETVDVRGRSVERFIAFRSDRSFRLEVDDRRFEWGAPKIKGLTVKQLVGAEPARTGVWLQRRDAPDLLIGDEDVVTLTANGVERLATGPGFVVCIESKELSWPRPTITTEEIVALGEWDPNLGVQEVNLLTGEARTLAPGEVVRLEVGKGFCKKIGWRRG